MIAGDLIAGLPASIAAQVHVLLPGLTSCEGMLGRFGLEELKARSLRTPAVLISMIDAKPRSTEAGPARRYDLRMAAYVITSGARDRDAAACVICQELLRAIPDMAWGGGQIGPAEKASMSSMITSAVRGAGASLWAVDWTQPVSLWSPATPAPVALELYAGDARPEGPTQYERIGGGP